MRDLIKLASFAILTVLAMSDFYSVFRARGSFCLSPIIKRMSECRKLAIGRVIAERTSFIRVPTDCKTGRFAFCVVLKRMTERVDVARFAVLAVLAMSDFYSVFRARRSFCLSPIIKRVPESRKLAVGRVIAERANFIRVPTD